MKRADEGIAEIERALALDPFNDLIQALSGPVFTWVGRYDDAIAQLEKALQTSPGNPVALTGLARALHHAGRLDESLAAERRLWTARGDAEMVAALSQQQDGFREALRRGADLLAARARKNGTAPQFIGIMYSRAGERDRALEWLQRSFDAHDPNVPFAVTGPTWQAFRGDPRFDAIHRKLGLP
jgi:adenylate cyclase